MVAQKAAEMTEQVQEAVKEKIAEATEQAKEVVAEGVQAVQEGAQFVAEAVVQTPGMIWEQFRKGAINWNELTKEQQDGMIANFLIPAAHANSPFALNFLQSLGYTVKKDRYGFVTIRKPQQSAPLPEVISPPTVGGLASLLTPSEEETELVISSVKETKKGVVPSAEQEAKIKQIFPGGTFRGFAPRGGTFGGVGKSKESPSKEIDISSFFN